MPCHSELLCILERVMTFHHTSCDVLNIFFFFSKVHDKAKTVLSRHWFPVTVTCLARMRWICGGGVGVFCKQLYKGVSLVKALTADFGSSSPKEMR